MFELYLPLFPSSYLSHSVITTVWIGIWVVSFFNLRYGWVFTGLIVPGYLTPLLLIKPMSVGVILFESVLTYLLVYVLSEFAARRGLWTNFFGRDRFFMILLASVGVRLFFDAWTLPWFTGYVQNVYGINLNYEDGFHSFGLIVVALIANQLWKPGLYRGLTQALVTIGITYLITRYVFVEYTNFSLSNIGYLYEDIASSILASPKSYIILIVTALIASRMNLFYGWEFNGILVPSLLALQWYQPSKILASFLEAYIILGLSMLVLRLPVFQHFSVEGARKILLFFNVSFVYKVILSFVVVYFFPESKVSDYFAFGYLLSTLIAIKMYDKVNMALFTRVTLQTSLVSIIIATAIGYFLTVLPDSTYSYVDRGKDTQAIAGHQSDKKIIEYIESKKVNLYGRGEQTVFQNPTATELETFRQALRLIDDGYLRHEQEIHRLLESLHYHLEVVEGHYVVLTQEKEYYGWGMYVIDMEQTGHHVIELPSPLETWDILESAVILMKLSGAKVMAISGVPFDLDGVLSASQFNSYYSLFHTFHKHYARDSVVQVRALNPRIQGSYVTEAASKEETSSLLFVKGYLPTELNLGRLKELLEKLDVQWNDETEFSIQKESMTDGFSELYLSAVDRRNLMASRLMFEEEKFGEEVSISSIEGLLQSWLLEKKLEIAEKESELYVSPTAAELLFFDNVILKPLFETLQHYQSREVEREALKIELLSVAFAAYSLGYKLTLYTDTSSKQHYVILHEPAGKYKRYWGTYVFRIGEARRIMVQAPRPFYESQTFEYALELFEKMGAQVLLLNGAHPLANADKSADVMLFENKANIFNLVSQVVFRQSGTATMNALQVRGMQQFGESGYTPAVLAFGTAIEGINADQRFIYTYLEKYIDVTVNEGDAYSAGYGALALQSFYLDQALSGTFNILWLPYTIRSQYRQLSQNDIIEQQFRSLGITALKMPFSHIAVQPSRTEESGCYTWLFNHAQHYLDSRDVTELAALKAYQGIAVKLLIDSNNNQPYMLLENSKTGATIGVLKLNSQPPYRVENLRRLDLLSEVIEAFSLNMNAILRMDTACEN